MSRLSTIALFAAALLLATPLAAKERPPEGSEPRPFQLPERTRFSLPNGLQANLIPFGAVPKVTILITVGTGNIDERGNTWLADLTGEMLKEGTANRGAADVARMAATMGGDISIGAGMDQTNMQADVLSEHGPEMLALLAEILMSPSLPSSEIERIRSDFLRNLSVARTQPGALASEAFYALIYPGHAYGRAYPTPEQLTGYTIDDVRTFHADNFGAARTRVYISGVFDPRRMEQAVRKAFGEWAAGPAPRVDIPATRNALRLELIDRPGAPQSTIQLGLAAADPSSADYLSFQMMNLLLGGAFSSRITANIREDKGYTYSPRSAVIPRYRSGIWRQVADVTTEHTGAAISEILKEIRRLQDELPTEDEVTAIRNYRTGTFIMGSATRGGLLGQMAFIDMHGLPDDYLTNYTRNVHRVGAADLTRMARQWLPTDRMTLVVVGDLAVVREQIAALPAFAGLASGQ